MSDSESRKFTLTLNVGSDSLIFHFTNGGYLSKKPAIF